MMNSYIFLIALFSFASSYYFCITVLKFSRYNKQIKFFIVSLLAVSIFGIISSLAEISSINQLFSSHGFTTPAIAQPTRILLFACAFAACVLSGMQLFIQSSKKTRR